MRVNCGIDLTVVFRVVPTSALETNAVVVFLRYKLFLFDLFKSCVYDGICVNDQFHLHFEKSLPLSAIMLLYKSKYAECF